MTFYEIGNALIELEKEVAQLKKDIDNNTKQIEEVKAVLAEIHI